MYAHASNPPSATSGHIGGWVVEELDGVSTSEEDIRVPVRLETTHTRTDCFESLP